MIATSSSSSRRPESNTIPVAPPPPLPRVHSSFDGSLKAPKTFSNARRSKKSQEEKILYPNDIIIEHHLNNNKNVNHFTPRVSHLQLERSEQTTTTKYTELLAHFFDTHQPAHIFEPLRKEYFWSDQPFDDEKINRLEKVLHSTSYFVQSMCWYLRLLLAICVTIPIEIIHTILAGLVKPVLVRVPVIVSDTLIKPLYSAAFNTVILPMGILLWNTSDLTAKTFEPLVRLCNILFDPCVDCCRSLRQSSMKTRHDETQENGDGDHSNERRKSVLCV